MAHMGVRTLPRRAKGRLCPGLDGTLSAAAAGSVKQPARDLITERLALESDRCSGDESRHRRTAVTRRHGAPQPTRWLKVAGEHAAILVAWGGDRWPACRWPFGQRCHVGEQRREDLGEEGADRGAPVCQQRRRGYGLAGWLTCGDGPGLVPSWVGYGESGPRQFFQFKSFF
jgi:hypothetical protein